MAHLLKFVDAMMQTERIATCRTGKFYTMRTEISSAHGGCMLRENGYFYWFGENRTGDNRVSCYRSRDLENWEFCRHVRHCLPRRRNIYTRSIC